VTRIYENPKSRSLLIILEGLGVSLAAHAFGGFYLAPKLIYDYEIMLPPVTIALLLTSSLSPVIAIVYLALRLKFIPNFRINKGSVVWVILGTILICTGIYLVNIITGGSYYSEEILRVPTPYQYFNLALIIVWTSTAEEILFRGYFFENLRRSWGNLIAIFVVSALFVIPHGIWGALYFTQRMPNFSLVVFSIVLTSIFVSSIIYTVTYLKAGLPAAILVHIFGNLFFYYL
jgi:membrane protease YdiL (CAAX protease family)